MAAIVGDEPTWDAPLRLLGGLHFLVLAGDASWDDALEAHADFLCDFVREQTVQTNEVQRSWALLPCFLRAAELLAVEELDVVELGPSAGLNLVWDRYRYSYEAGEWGPDGAPLRLEGEERSRVPSALLEVGPRVARRVGIDLAPIDVTTDEGARLLTCFVWAGQDERFDRLTRAIEAVRADPPELVRGDFADELPKVLGDRTTLVFETAAFPYVSDETRATVRETLSRAESTRSSPSQTKRPSFSRCRRESSRRLISFSFGLCGDVITGRSPARRRGSPHDRRTRGRRPGRSRDASPNPARHRAAYRL